MRTVSIALQLVVVALVTTGCSVDQGTIQSLRDAVHTVSAPSTLAESDATKPASMDSSFDPPHPNRVDPFAFPSNGPVVDQATTTIATVAQVEVLGFAHVDQPRVFLRTKESTRSLKVGDVTNGIRVMAINAPTVELKMGSLVWTASMFDQSIAGRD